MSVEVAAASHFSESWFTDARDQSLLPNRHARRREIVFAVCLAETYLFEWVLHQLFPGNWAAADAYFPAGSRRSVYDKWQEIPAKLVVDGRLPVAPDLGGPHGADWLRLLDLRDWLIHAAVSRPRVRVDHNLPMSSFDAELESLAPGWALGVVVERMRRLHTAAGTPPPEWLPV